MRSSISGACRYRYGHRALLTVGLFTAAEKHVFDHAERSHPIYYQYPETKLDDMTIELN